MDQIIPRLYREYGEYINSYRSFPHELDGLKPVERRVLLVSYNVCKDKLVKSARVVGDTIGKYHPHGDSSAYGTLVQLVKQKFLIGQGNFGVDLGVEPMPAASMRYTECRLDKYFHDMVFKLIKYVPWIDGEMSDIEPQFLPTRYPVCLMGKEYTQGIGFAYRTVIPCYEIKDLKQRLLWLLGKRKSEPIIAPISNCKIISDKEDLQQILKTGKGSIKLEGFYEISNGRCEATLRSWPPGKRFESLLSKFKTDLDSGNVGFTDASNEENGTEIIFEILKRNNRDKIFRNFIKIFKIVLIGNQSFEMMVTGIDGKVKLMSVDEMLLNTYSAYTKVNENMLKINIQKLEEEIKENILIQKIAPLLSVYLKEMKDINVDTVIEEISRSINEDIKLIKDIFSKYTIRKLLTFKSEIKSLDEKKKVFENNLDNLDQFVLDQYL